MANKKSSSIRWDRIAWKRVIPALVLLLLVIYLIISLIVGLFHREKTPDIYTIGNMNAKQTLQAVQNEKRDDPVLIKDYNFYGESLNLFYENYVKGDNQINLSDQTVTLIDMIDNNNKASFEISRNNIDNQINLGNLKEGFYSVYINDGSKDQRVYFDHTLVTNNTMYTVTRNNSRMVVEMIANKKLFDAADAEESVLDQAYLYIKVTKEEADKDGNTTNNDYDVVIMSSPALTERGVSVVGEEANGLVEGEELYNVAEQLVAILKEKGLRVQNLKPGAGYDAHLFYGEGGLAHDAYKSKAKYFIYLDMTNLDYERGTIYSGYSSGTMPKYLHDKLMEIGLFASENYLYASELYPGVAEDPSYFDGEYEIRETGGTVLGAAKYSESSAENASFAANNIYGINTVKICTTNIYATYSVNEWNNCKDKVAQAIADGFLEYLNADFTVKEQPVENQ